MSTPSGMIDVLSERVRQRAPKPSGEGWDDEHDDFEHIPGDLAAAAICYARDGVASASALRPDDWPWSDNWWKPKGRRRNLVRAAALLIAEIDRFDRDAERGRREAAEAAKGGKP